MRRFLTTLLCLILPTLALAQTPPAAGSADLITAMRNGQIDIGGSFDRTAGAKTARVFADALAPLVGHLSVGPMLRLHYQDAQEGYGLGGIVEYDFGKAAFRPFVAADVVRWVGGYDAVHRYEMTAAGGFKLGTPKVYLRLGFDASRAYRGGGGFANATAISAGLGIRL